MVPLEQETNIEVLRAYSLIATREVDRLSKELAEARKQESEEGYLSEALRDQLTKLQEKFFGFGREKTDIRPATHHKNAQLLIHGNRMASELEAKTESDAHGNGAKTVFYESIISELIEEAVSRGFEMSKAKNWEEINSLTQDSVEITVVERTYQKVIHKQKKYRFLPSVGTEKELIPLFQGSCHFKLLQ
jgi:hypothetical protein